MFDWNIPCKPPPPSSSHLRLALAPPTLPPPSPTLSPSIKIILHAIIVRSGGLISHLSTKYLTFIILCIIICILFISSRLFYTLINSNLSQFSSKVRDIGNHIKSYQMTWWPSSTEEFNAIYQPFRSWKLKGWNVSFLIESDFMLRKKQNHGTTQTKKNEFGRGMEKGDTGWTKTSINC